MSDEFMQNGTVGDVVTNSTVSEKSKIVAAVLCFFLGMMGIHRFYVGKIGSGIAMLVLGILGALLTVVLIGFVIIVPLGIWVLVDFIMILMGSFKDKEGRPVTK